MSKRFNEKYAKNKYIIRHTKSPKQIKKAGGLSLKSRRGFIQKLAGSYLKAGGLFS